MSKSEPVKVERRGGVATVIMNRPEKRNAMSPDLHRGMDQALAALEVDPEVKCVVIRGAGGNFSAGQDLKEFFRALEDKPAEAKQIQEVANRWRWHRLYNYDKPTIAMIEGYLPKAASEDEIRAVVAGAIAHLSQDGHKPGLKDIGAAMRVVQQRLQANGVRADGKLVSDTVKAELAK
ncbi:MAG: GatB/YqeY domain-containing protein [Rhizobiales bacterium]|nr:GatB/YqeY domain-containing protein [Hyphomicrobiales bacterium]